MTDYQSKAEREIEGEDDDATVRIVCDCGKNREVNIRSNAELLADIHAAKTGHNPRIIG